MNQCMTAIVSSETRLSHLRVGSRATLLLSNLDEKLASLLGAIGLTDGSSIRICRQGGPCIVQVRSTRVGLARSLAERISVSPISGDPWVADLEPLPLVVPAVS